MSHKRDDLVEDFGDTFPGNFRGQTCYEIDSLWSQRSLQFTLDCSRIGAIAQTDTSYWRISRGPTFECIPESQAQMSLRGVNVETNVYAPPRQPGLAIEKRRTGLSGIGPGSSSKVAAQFYLTGSQPSDLWRRCWKCLVPETFR